MQKFLILKIETSPNGARKTHKDTDNFLVTVGDEPLNTN
jgi:hypothetical protein